VTKGESARSLKKRNEPVANSKNSAEEVTDGRAPARPKDPSDDPNLRVGAHGSSRILCEIRSPSSPRHRSSLHCAGSITHNAPSREKEKTCQCEQAAASLGSERHRLLERRRADWDRRSIVGHPESAVRLASGLIRPHRTASVNGGERCVTPERRHQHAAQSMARIHFGADGLRLSSQRRIASCTIAHCAKRCP